MFGYGIVLSDTCVTITDPTGEKKYHDAVQKAFPLAPFVVGGFAGSIYIGFKMIDSLRRFLTIPESEGECAWELDWVAEKWQKVAKEVFDKAPERERRGGSHIILVAAHPSEDVGIPGFARVHIAVLKSPNFEPVVTKGEFLTIESIGSGAKAYAERLKSLKPESFNLATMEVGFSGGLGSMVTQKISDHLRDNPSSGVSPHLHIFTVKRGGFTIGSNNYFEYKQDGTESEFVMPLVADSYKKLVKQLQEKGVDSTGSLLTA